MKTILLKIFSTNKNTIVQTLVLIYTIAILIGIFIDLPSGLSNFQALITLAVVLTLLNVFSLYILIKQGTHLEKQFYFSQYANILYTIAIQELQCLQSNSYKLTFFTSLIIILHTYSKLILLTQKQNVVLVLLLQLTYILIRNIFYLSLSMEESLQLVILLFIILVKILPFQEFMLFDQQSTFLSIKNVQSVIQKGQKIDQSEIQFGLNNNAEEYIKVNSKLRIQDQKMMTNQKIHQSGQNYDSAKHRSFNLNNREFMHLLDNNGGDSQKMCISFNCLNDLQNGIQDYFDLLSTGVAFFDEKKCLLLQNKSFINLYKTYFQSYQTSLNSNINGVNTQNIEITEILKINLKYELPKIKLEAENGEKNQEDVLIEESKTLTNKFEENSQQLKDFFIKEQEITDYQQLRQSIQQNDKGTKKGNANELSQIPSDRDESVQSKDRRQSNLITNSSWILNNSNQNAQIDVSSFSPNNKIYCYEFGNNEQKIKQTKTIIDYQCSRNLKDLIKKSRQCKFTREGLLNFFTEDNNDLELDKLLDYLLVSKPFTMSEKEVQQSYYEYDTECNLKKQKSQISDGKYRIRLLNNSIMITMNRYSVINKKNEVIELKISCYCYDEQASNNNVSLFQQQSQPKFKNLISNGINIDSDEKKNGFGKKQNICPSLKGLSKANINCNCQSSKKEKKNSQVKFSQIDNKKMSIIANQEESKDELSVNQLYGEQKYFISIEVHEIGFNIQNAIKHDLDKYRTKILCSVSHELRTPLNCTITMLDMLNFRDDISDLVKNVYVNPALFSSYILLNIVNDILDMAEVDRSGQISMIFQEFSPAAVCLECLKFIKLQALQKNLQLEFFADENVPQIIYTDISKTRQVLLNLLNNALKYTQKGSITIRLSSPTEDLIQVDVKDTGCGIPQHALKQIFYNFTKPINNKNHLSNRPNELETHKTTINAGFGLSISYTLAACLGDNKKMTVASQVDKGSTFSFFLVNRPQKKKGCTLFPNIKQNEAQTSSMNSRDWIEQDSYFPNQAADNEVLGETNYIIKPSQTNLVVESSLKVIKDNLKDKILTPESKSEQLIQDNDQNYKIPSSNRLIKNNLHLRNGIRSSHLINQIKQTAEESDHPSKQCSKEELYPETDKDIGKCIKKRMNGSAMQINFSKTAYQIIQQTSTIFQFLQSQQNIEELTTTNKKVSSSSSRNLTNQITFEQQNTLDPQLTMDQHIKGCLTKGYNTSEEYETSFNNQASITSMLYRTKDHMQTLGTLGTKEFETQSRGHVLSHYNSNTKRTNFSSRNPSSKYIKDKTLLQYDTLQEFQSVKDVFMNNKTINEDGNLKRIHFEEGSNRRIIIEENSLKKSLFDENNSRSHNDGESIFKRSLFEESNSKKTSNLEDIRKQISTYNTNMIYEEIDGNENQSSQFNSKIEIESCNVMNESFEKKAYNQSIESPHITKVQLFAKQKHAETLELQAHRALPSKFIDQKQQNSFKTLQPDYKQQFSSKLDNKQHLRPNASILVTFHPDASITNSSIYNQTSIMNNNVNSNLTDQINAFNLNSNMNCLNTNIQITSTTQNNSASSNNHNNITSNFSSNQQSSNYNIMLQSNCQSSISNQVNINQNGLIVQNSSMNNFNTPNIMNNQSPQSTLNNINQIEPQQKGSMDVLQDYRSLVLHQGGVLNGEELRQHLISMNKSKQCQCSSILIVDDNEFNLYALEVRLKMYQFSIDKATSGFQCLEFIHKKNESSCCKSYQLIFMDIDMPLKNGYETTEELILLCTKQLHTLPPPISACSAFIQESDKEKAYKSGMSYYLTKPINQQAFENILLKVFILQR